MKSRFLLALTATAALAAALPAVAQTGVSVVEGQPYSAGAKPAMAMPFLVKAGASDQFEIQSSRLALERSRNQELRTFAQMLIDHHTRLTAATTAAARSAGLTPPPPNLEPHQRVMIEELQRSGAGDFDSLYIRQQVGGHQGALGVMRTYSMMGDTPALRQAATSAIPVVQGHLADAERMAMAMAR